MKWLYSSLIAFVLSFAIAVVFIFRGLHILGSDKAILYFIILVPLGIASSLMLFKVMRSYATLKGSYLNYHLELAGPVAVFFLVIGGGYYFYKNPPNPVTFPLTVRFLDKATRQGLTGKAEILSSDQRQTYSVDKDAIVKGAIAGNELEILPDFPNYSRASIRYTIPDFGKPLEVLLEQDVQRAELNTRLRIRFASAFSLYTSVAKDYNTVLQNDIDDLLDDSARIGIEFNSIAIRYAEAYKSLIVLKDSIIIVSEQQSTQNNSHLEVAYDQFLRTHETFLKFSDDMRDRINNFYDTHDRQERSIITNAVATITRDASRELTQLERDVSKAISSF